MFSPSGIQTPCVGVSIGIERVFTIIERKAEELKLSQASPIQVCHTHMNTVTSTVRLTHTDHISAVHTDGTVNTF
jgi:histidyl-tRNA synthetase